jgi:hypothetical protein
MLKAYAIALPSIPKHGHLHEFWGHFHKVYKRPFEIKSIRTRDIIMASNV